MNIYEEAIEKAIIGLGYTNEDYIEEWNLVIREAREILESYTDEYGDEWWWGLYTAYLKSTHWETLRKNVLECNNFQCTFCKNKASQVHHLSYVNLYEENEIDDLIPLCSGCHNGIHGLNQRMECKDWFKEEGDIK